MEPPVSDTSAWASATHLCCTSLAHCMSTPAPTRLSLPDRHRSHGKSLILSCGNKSPSVIFTWMHTPAFPLFLSHMHQLAPSVVHTACPRNLKHLDRWDESSNNSMPHSKLTREHPHSVRRPHYYLQIWCTSFWVPLHPCHPVSPTYTCTHHI